jgi:hypothetical protein
MSRTETLRSSVLDYVRAGQPYALAVSVVAREYGTTATEAARAVARRRAPARRSVVRSVGESETWWNQ